MTSAPRVAVLAPTPVLTVMIERHEHGEPEIHLHAGGQGFWVARMARALGADVAYCAPLGGETGIVLRSLLAAAGLDLRIVPLSAANGAYVQERGGSDRVALARSSAPPLTRHEADELYGAMLTAGLAADVSALTGSDPDSVVEADFYRRIAADLRRNGRFVAVDLSGAALTAAVSAGIDFLHVNERELREHFRSPRANTAGLVPAIAELRERGVQNVLVSRGPDPALAGVGDKVIEIAGPRLAPRDHRGAGDTMFAAIVAGLAAGLEPEAAIRRGVAAGALNVVRHGLGTGSPQDVERLADAVSIRAAPDQ